MEFLIWTALIVGFGVFAVRVLPEFLVVLMERAERHGGNGPGHQSARVPAHVVDRLARQRHRR